MRIAELNRTFINNMEALWRHDPVLAQCIDELPLDACLETVPSRKGPLTAIIKTPDGRRLYLHSRNDPAGDAANFVSGLISNEVASANKLNDRGSTDKNEDDTTSAACVVLAGLGLGYHLKTIHEQFGSETVVFITEPDLVTIKTAFETIDLSKEISTGRVEFITWLDKASLHNRLNRHATLLMLGTVFAVPLIAREHNSEFHATARTAISDFAAFSKMSLITLVKNAVITARNVANNLPTYVTTPPPDILRRRFTGYPAVLVAAGPSLQKNIHHLRDAQDRAVIIAAQTTLRPLLEHGIKPHFVVSLDFSDLSRQFFEGLAIPEDVILVAEPKASWHVVDTFMNTGASGGTKKAPHRVILLDNDFARRCIGDTLAPRSRMEPGATVMHLAFYLSQWLGCDPIIFIGQDLAFTGHCYYAPGVTMHRTWGAELGRFCTLEMKEWERIARQRAILRTVKDWDGHSIYTDEQMFTYLEQFERDFVKSKSRVIDASEGGARKSGATAMTLASALEQFCSRPIDSACIDFRRPKWMDHSKLKHGGDELTTRRHQLDEFRKLCQKTLRILDELMGLVENPDEFNRRVSQMDELRTVVQRHEHIFAMVRDVSQLAELQKFAADHRLAGDKPVGASRARRQIQRDRRFLTALLDGCGQLDTILEEAIERFRSAAGQHDFA